MDKLMGRLDKLSGAIGQLNPANSPTGSQESGGLEMMVSKQNGAPRWQQETKIDEAQSSKKSSIRHTLVRQKESLVG
jgi:hypothetical protein